MKPGWLKEKNIRAAVTWDTGADDPKYERSRFQARAAASSPFTSKYLDNVTLKPLLEHLWGSDEVDQIQLPRIPLPVLDKNGIQKKCTLLSKGYILSAVGEITSMCACSVLTLLKLFGGSRVLGYFSLAIYEALPITAASTFTTDIPPQRHTPYYSCEDPPLTDLSPQLINAMLHLKLALATNICLSLFF